jgi:hypothetical protein
LLRKYGAREIYFKDGLSSDTVKGQSGVTLTALRDAPSSTAMVRREVGIEKKAYPGLAEKPIAKVKGATCLVGHYGTSASFQSPLQICIVPAKQYMIVASVYDGTTANGDLAKVAKLVGEQLKLTPQ